MQHPPIYTFQNCLDISEQAGGNRHLMLGNGFSCSIFPNIFNYKALADRINSKTVKSLFTALGTNDFEDVMRRITNTLVIANLYPEGSDLTVKLEKDLDDLKNTLIEVITESHPPNPQAEYRNLLKSKGYIGSMSRKGDCWDNSVVESFFGSLKQERVQWRNYQTRWEAQQDILNYITMFYNSHRLHSYLGYLSPNQFENRAIY